MRMQVPDDRCVGKRQVTDTVENLVTRKFIREAKTLGIDNAIIS